VITQTSSSFSATRRTVRAEKETGTMNPPSSPSLLETIRLLLQKVEGTSYPRQDPSSIENLKAYLRCRMAELEVEEGIRALPPKATSQTSR